MLWELVHVFFEHRGLLEGRSERRCHDAGASSFLYPFLAEREHDLDAVLADVRRVGADEGRGGRSSCARETLDENAASRCGRGARRCASASTRGGTLLALGNGGSATDAMDVVADFAAAAGPRRRST